MFMSPMSMSSLVPGGMFPRTAGVPCRNEETGGGAVDELHETRAYARVEHKQEEREREDDDCSDGQRVHDPDERLENLQSSNLRGSVTHPRTLSRAWCP